MTLPKISLLLFTAALGLGACAPAIPVILPGQTFEGYPCQDNCASFEQGYTTAQARQLKTSTQCNQLEEAQQLGCRSYLYEYDLEHNQPPGYSFPVNQ